MNNTWIRGTARVMVLVGWLAGTVDAAVPPATRPLVLNGGFEEDDFNTRGERMGCPVRPRVTYGQSDGIPDRWEFAAERVREAHSGRYAAKLTPSGKNKLNHSFIYAAQTGESVLPPIRFAAWIKGSGANDAVAVSLKLTVAEPDAKTGQGKAVAVLEVKKLLPAPARWAEVEFAVTSEEVVAALKDRTQPVGLITGSLTLQAGDGSQAVVVDDVELLCPVTPAPYTLVPNPGFEALDGTDYPRQWSQPRKSLRYVGSNYYVWRDWFHFLGVPRGTTEIDRLVVAAGASSLRLAVPPGDDRYIETADIVLNQAQPQRMVLQFDYQSHLLANLLVQVVDDQGHEVYVRNIVAGTTAGWTTFHAEFLPRKTGVKAGAGSIAAGADVYGATGDALALKGCQVRIGVKGVNGSAMDDINEWVNVNHAGVLWLDNVVLAETAATARELKARGARTYPLTDRAPAVTVASIDLGERLYGENIATVRLANRSGKPVNGTITMTVSGPYRESDPQKAGYAMGATGQDQADTGAGPLAEQVIKVAYAVPPQGGQTLEFPYTISRLLKDWRSEYRVRLDLGKGRSTTLPFGTWSQQALVEVEKCYPFPNETPQPVFMNIGVARQTLERVQKVRLTLHRVRDDGQVGLKEIPDFGRVMQRFNLAPLPEVFEGDNSNFLLTDIAIDALPVHPQTRPVRDHYVAVTGLDAAGKAVFQARSPAFGRMEVHTEKLDPIREVRIHPDNYLMLNGKPFFSRGHIWMQQNFGPSPFARQNTDWKTAGFNNKAGVQSPFADSSSDRYGLGMDEVWAKHHTYIGSQMIAPQGPMTDAIRADLQKWLGKPYIVGLHFIPWEGGPAGPADVSVQYAKQIKEIIKPRALWVSSGWYAPGVNGRLYPAQIEHDWFMPENNAYFQPSQLDREVLPLKQRRGEPCVLGTYPNVFNDTPYAVQRFEHWTEIIRGHTGYMQIGKPGDPSLMRGLNGEFRFIESFLFSQEPAPAVTAAPRVEHLVRANDRGVYILASNAGPIIGGDWEWNAELRDQGQAAHTGTAFWSRLHDYLQDYHTHFYHGDQPVTLRKTDTIAQYVFIPKGARVDALMLMARGNAEWRYHAVWGKFDHAAFTDSGVRLWMAKDMHQMSWGTTGIGFCGPEGHDIKNPELLKHTFTADQFHRLGDLPAAGQWVRLEVPVGELGLDGMLLDGLGFVSKGSKVWWERTLLVRDGAETVLCDGSVGIPPSQLSQVRFSVAGLKAGTRVKVCFEERDIVAGDGYFEDDLSGEPGYRNLWVGLYGDKIGETGYYGDGVFYNYNWGKVAARLYEISKSPE
ncbi:hypothetical protein HQ590_02860 [bacterium]|nr:hypothetical protein [bacterium]